MMRVRVVMAGSLVCLGALLLALTTGCKPSQTVSATTPPVKIQGELITGVKESKPSASERVNANQTGTVQKDYSPVGFDRLASYDFEVDETPVTNAPGKVDAANTQIPTPVKSLDERKVTITGFMLPLRVADGTVTEFLIMKDQSMCCYGATPKINEWVNVKTTHGVKPIMDQPVSMEGTLHVGAARENGYLISIYRMDGDKLILNP